MAPVQVQNIHIAVLHNDLPRVRALLHRKAANVNLPDSKGATPLMLAALIGSPKLVTFLLERRASWQAMDRAGHGASAYVRGPFSEQMKIRYKGLMKRRSSAHSPKQRRDIHDHLSDAVALRTQYHAKPAGTLVFQRHGNSLSIYKLIAKVKVAGPISDNRTAACIAAANSIKPLMCAASGWTAIDSPGVVNGADYTEVVRDIAKLFNFELPRHCYDTPGGGSPEEKAMNVGRFNASHCEKLLAAFWVCEQLKFLFGSADLSRLRELKSADLPVHRRKAALYLDHRPCIPCRLFLAAIQKTTGIEISPFPQVLVKEISRGIQGTNAT